MARITDEQIPVIKYTDKIPDAYVSHFKGYGPDGCGLCLINFVAHGRRIITHTKVEVFIEDMIAEINNYLHKRPLQNKLNMQVDVKILDRVMPEIPSDYLKSLTEPKVHTETFSNYFEVFSLVIDFLQKKYIFRLRLVSKNFTFDKYNYLKYSSLTQADIYNIKIIPMFLKKQKYFHENQLVVNFPRFTETQFNKCLEHMKNIRLIEYIHTLNLKEVKFDQLTLHIQLDTLNLNDSVIKNIVVTNPVKHLYLSGAQYETIALDQVNEVKFDRMHAYPVLKRLLHEDLHKDIEVLSLADNKLENIFFIAEMKNLRILDVHNNYIEDVSVFQDMKCESSICPYKKWNKNHCQVHIVNLADNHIEDITPLIDVYDLNVSRLDSPVYKMSTTGHVKSLIVKPGKTPFRCFKLDISHSSIGTDASVFANVHTLNMYNTSIVNVSKLGIGRCNISKCQYSKWRIDHSINHILILGHTPVKDVSTLSDVYHLDLYKSQVRDVSTLGRVHRLDISYTKPSGIENLWNVDILVMRGCAVKFSSLGVKNCGFEKCKLKGNMHVHIRNLDLRDTQTQSVRNFGNVDNLQLMNTQVKDVKHLSHVRKLDLSFTAVTDVSPLKDIYELDISSTSRIKEVSGLHNLKYLNAMSTYNLKVYNCEKLYSISLSASKFNDMASLQQLKNLVSLTLNNCSSLKQFVSLDSVQDLDLSFTFVEILPKFVNLVSLEVQGCGKLTDISNLKYSRNLRNLNLSSTSVEDVSVLANLDIIYLVMSNTKIKNVNMLSQHFESINISNSPVIDASPLYNAKKIITKNPEHKKQLSVASFFGKLILEDKDLPDTPPVTVW
ncbi:MAG TPA: leucine-rich repeat domain-containing protein [Nitrosarchaeum sp.]|nr:leucine-rich repeat domain-containing protein [Nitrosarchaeum sp.]